VNIGYFFREPIIRSDIFAGTSAKLINKIDVDNGDNSLIKLRHHHKKITMFFSVDFTIPQTYPAVSFEIGIIKGTFESC
jgi:hypothetical protein